MANYVSHAKKLKAADLKGIEIHNERKEGYNLGNEDIIQEKKDLNYDLIGDNSPKNYNNLVKLRIQEGYEGRKIRDNATLAVSVVTSASADFFEGKGQEDIKAYFMDNLELLKEQFGEKNIISSKVHLDESTPHMHTIIVPLTEDKRLSAKELFDRKSLKRLQDNALKLQKKGWSVHRGVEKSQNKHLDDLEYKVQQEKLKLAELEKSVGNIEISKEKLDSMMTDIMERKTNVPVEAEKDSFFSKAKAFISSYEGFKIRSDELNYILKLAMKGLTSKDLAQELEVVKNDLRASEKQANLNHNKYWDSHQELRKLTPKINKLEAENLYIANVLRDIPLANKIRPLFENVRSSNFSELQVNKKMASLVNQYHKTSEYKAYKEFAPDSEKRKLSTLEKIVPRDIKNRGIGR